MDGCILCLDINKELVDSITVESTQWQELQIKTLIDKYLWTMDTLKPFSWLCHECWQTLFDFHKFYMRIEEAHMDIGLLVKTKIEVIVKDEKEAVPSDEYNHPDESNDIFESHLDSDISVDPLVTEDHKPDIKDDPDDDDKFKDNVPIISQRPKRGQKSKDLTNDTEKIDDNPFKNSNKKALKSNSKHKISKKRKKAIAECTGNLDTSSDDGDDSITDSDCYAKKKSLRYRQSSKEIDKFLTDNFKLTCVLCQLSMDTFKTLLNHFEMEHKEQGYAVCCDKKFYRRMVLFDHVHHHIDPSYFKCFECGKEMNSRKTLKGHQIVHLSEEQKKFTCSKCGKNFAARSILSKHMKAVHLKKYSKICDICGKSLSYDTFERHMLQHEGKPMPQVNCDICGLLLSNKKNLKRHVSMLHPVGGEQTHNCHLCPKISPNINALKDHIRNVHLLGNVHKCTMCGRGFKRKLALKEHMATHTGIALYTCPWCPKTSNGYSSMHAHRKKHHPVECEEAQKQQKNNKYISPNALEIKNTDLQ